MVQSLVEQSCSRTSELRKTLCPSGTKRWGTFLRVRGLRVRVLSLTSMFEKKSASEMATTRYILYPNGLQSLSRGSSERIYVSEAVCGV